LHAGSWAAVLDDPIDFSIFSRVLKGTIREVARRLCWVEMGGWPVTFSLDSMAEKTPPFSLVDSFSGCDDVGRSRAGIAVRSL
jgi:hypothetical protein